MSDDHLSGCHCCEGQQPRPAIYNDPGLPALAWRIDIQPRCGATRRRAQAHRAPWRTWPRASPLMPPWPWWTPPPARPMC